MTCDSKSYTTHRHKNTTFMHTTFVSNGIPSNDIVGSIFVKLLSFDSAELDLNKKNCLKSTTYKFFECVSLNLIKLDKVALRDTKL